MAVSIVWALTQLASADCAPLEIPLDGATALGVSRLPAEIEIVGTEGATVLRATSEECGLRISRDDHILLLSGPGKVGRVRLEVPTSLTAITVYRHQAGVKVSDVPARVAVVSGEGPVEARRVGHLRVGEVVGDVFAEDVKGDLLVDHLTGVATWERVEGNVSVDDTRASAASLLAR
jgi:hypothetical protein